MGSFKSSRNVGGKAGKAKAAGGGWKAAKTAVKSGEVAAKGGVEEKTEEEIAALEPIIPDATYWVSDPDVVWTQVVAVSQAGLMVTIKDAAGATRQINLKVDECHKCNPRVVDDMTSLHSMHEPGVMYNLEDRARCDLAMDPGTDGQKPYTYVQSVVLAMNPLRRVPDPPKETYYGKKMMDVDPHPFAIAESAFEGLSSTSAAATNNNQSIVISGESGAGKTESTKICLNYLTDRKPAAQGCGNTTGLDKRILDSNPILESYGNAKTTRNPNSSRFGKFMILQFTADKYELCGATMETYLLEKSRIVFQMKDERNYHVFYLICAGCDEETKQSLSLAPPEQNFYQNQSGCIVITKPRKFDDVAEYKDFYDAMIGVGMTADDIFSTFQVLSSILNIGNCVFEDKVTGAGEEATVIERAWLDCAAHQLGVESDVLNKVLVEEMREVKGEVFFSQRNAKMATAARDAITKTIYQLLFDWIVNRVAESLNQQPANTPFIGVLDIFGFETFAKNDFEQLLINFANENLQGTFNKCVLAAEMQLYKEEEIQVDPIKIPNNDAACQLIGGRPKGVLCQLEAVAMAPSPTDLKFCSAIHKLHADNQFFPRPHPRFIRENFIIRHFADDVQYTVGTFIQKNDAKVPKDLMDMLLTCPHTCLVDAVKAAGNSGIKYVTGLFATQMKGLIDKLESTDCNFIRCIKPNPQMQAGAFDRSYTINQLRFLGVLNTCKVLKLGLPSRVNYEMIGEPLREALPEKLKYEFRRYNSRKVTNAVLWSAQIPWDDYRLGKTRCFFRAGKIGQLDDIMKMSQVGLNTPKGEEFLARMHQWLVRERWRWSGKLVMNLLASKWLLELIRKKPGCRLKLQSFFRMQLKRKYYKKKQLAVQRWQLAMLHQMACQNLLVHCKYVHDNKAVMILKQKEIRRKRLQQRLRGDVGGKKKKKAAVTAEGEEGVEDAPQEESAFSKKVKAKIKATLASRTRKQAQGEMEGGSKEEVGEDVKEAIVKVNDAMRMK
jgi:myosin heavy subunit